jgi:radical SAM protein with 4Fe4S-binding SPASM domain
LYFTKLLICSFKKIKEKDMKTLDQRYEEGEIGRNLRYGIIEVTTKCQCLCLGCYMVRREALNKNQMSYERAILILDLCKDFIGKELETMDILGGEPLLWPFLKDYITNLIARGITPWIFTNMLSIKPELAKWLFEREIHITGKLNINPEDSSQIETQAKMLGRNLFMAKKLISSIKIFQSVGYKSPLFRLQNLIRKENISLVPGYYDWCFKNNIGTDLELMGSGEPIDEKYWEVAPTPKQIAQMIPEVQEIRKKYNLKPAKVLMPHVFGSCPFYDKGLYFVVDGNIRSCSNSTVILSNIEEPNSISKAWNSPLLCKRRELCKEKVGEPCHSCEIWDECRGGCRATSEGMGNAFAGYPLCPLPYLKMVID